MTNNHSGHHTANRVLVTGHNGYIGSVLVRHLIQAGYEVVGLDTGYFRACTFAPDSASIPETSKDIETAHLRNLYGQKVDQVKVAALPARERLAGSVPALPGSFGGSHK